MPIFPGVGVFGSLKSFRHEPLKLLMRGFREMGNVVRFRVFTRFLVLVAHPNHARRVLQDSATNYNKQTPGLAVLRDLLQDGLLTSQGEHWLAPAADCATGISSIPNCEIRKDDDNSRDHTGRHLAMWKS